MRVCVRFAVSQDKACPCPIEVDFGVISVKNGRALPLDLLLIEISSSCHDLYARVQSVKPLSFQS